MLLHQECILLLSLDNYFSICPDVTENIGLK